MNYYCYILFSKKLNKFYIGSTSNSVGNRLEQHLTDLYGKNKFTHAAKDWTVFYKISCTSYKQAMTIEKHIKKMKSTTYIRNLKKYPEISQRLLQKYK